MEEMTLNEFIEGVNNEKSSDEKRINVSKDDSIAMIECVIGYLADEVGLCDEKIMTHIEKFIYYADEHYPELHKLSFE